MARLILSRDGVDLGTHELVPDIVMIGRAPLNHIVIDDPTVSAHHARLLRAADSYWLADLHSTNGTQLNSVSITDAKLKDGDKSDLVRSSGCFAGGSDEREVLGGDCRQSQESRWEFGLRFSD